MSTRMPSGLLPFEIARDATGAVNLLYALNPQRLVRMEGGSYRLLIDAGRLVELGEDQVLWIDPLEDRTAKTATVGREVETMAGDGLIKALTETLIETNALLRRQLARLA